MKQLVIIAGSFNTRITTPKLAVDPIYNGPDGFQVMDDAAAVFDCFVWHFSEWHTSCFILTVPTQGRVSAQTDRKQCEIAKGSVKFEKVIEEQESRRTRKEDRLDNNNNPLRAFERKSNSQAAYLKP